MRTHLCQTCESKGCGRGNVVRRVALVTTSLICLSLLATPGHAAMPGANTAISLPSAISSVILGGFPAGPPVIIPKVQMPRSPFQPPSWVPPVPSVPGKPSWVPAMPPWVGR
jgi:hypothetical protein